MSSQLLKCLCCEEAQTLHVVAGVSRRASCEGSASLCQEHWEEDVSGRTFVPVRSTPACLVYEQKTAQHLRKSWQHCYKAPVDLAN